MLIEWQIKIRCTLLFSSAMVGYHLVIPYWLDIIVTRPRLLQIMFHCTNLILSKYFLAYSKYIISSSSIICDNIFLITINHVIITINYEIQSLMFRKFAILMFIGYNSHVFLLFTYYNMTRNLQLFKCLAYFIVLFCIILIKVYHLKDGLIGRRQLFYV